MKLLMVARRFPPDVRSGTETVFENLYRRARRRHELRLVVGFRRAREKVPPEAVAVDLRGASRARSWARLGLAALREERRFRPDVVLSNSIEVGALRAPVACIVHDVNFGRAGRGFGAMAREAFYRVRGGRLAAVITVSEASRTVLLGLGLPPERLHVVHNGVDLDLFRPLPSRPSGGPFHFVCPGRVLPGKGQHIAVDALSRLPARLKRRARLSVVGAVADPVYFGRLEVQAAGQPVELAGDVQEIAGWYQRADAILFPSMMREGFGFTAVEGMACGKPVAWFDQPAVREATGGIGIAVPMGDVDALRSAMARLMEEPELCARLGARGRSFVEERYHWERAWERYEALLEGLAGARGPRG